MNTNIEVLRELDELVEAARLLGVTQAKRGFGCHTDEDRRFERAMYESIDRHRAALLDWEAKQPAPQQPTVDGCHCGTCTCNPNMTPAVRFDLTPAQKEEAIRKHLIRLGWTPPAGAAEDMVLDAIERRESSATAAVDEAAVKRAVAAVMSAPVGISMKSYVRIVLEAALAAQQPAAVDEAYPTPRNRAEAVALARLALAHLGVIDAHIDAAIARCETGRAARQQEPTT